MGMQDRDWYREEVKRKAREMRASREDAPRYIGKKSEGPSLGIAMVIGCAITAAALLLWSNFQKFEEPQPAADEPHAYVPRHNFEEPAKPAGPTPEERFWAEQNQAKKERQTEFNDSNYTPRGADNVVAFEKVEAQQEPNQAARRPKEVVVVGVQRDRANEACSFFYKEGSVEKRDCKAEFNLSTRNQ